MLLKLFYHQEISENRTVADCCMGHGTGRVSAASIGDGLRSASTAAASIGDGMQPLALAGVSSSSSSNNTTRSSSFKKYTVAKGPLNMRNTLESLQNSRGPKGLSNH